MELNSVENMPKTKKREMSKIRDSLPIGAVIVLFFIHLFLILLALYRGRYTGDEGIYLASVKLLLEGNFPYRDFHFPQPPLILYFHAIWAKFFGQSFLTARWLSLLLSISSFWMIIYITKKLRGWGAAFLAALMLTLHLSYAFECAIVKTQPISIFMYCLGLTLLLAIPQKNVWKYYLVMAIMCIAVSSRVSLIFLLPAFWFYVYCDTCRSWKHVSGVSILSLLFTLGGFLYFYVLSKGKIMFGLYDHFYMLYSKHEKTTQELLWEFFSQAFDHQAVNYLLLLMVVSYGVYTLNKNRERFWEIIMRERFSSFLFLSFVGAMFIHYHAPFVVPTHEITIMPMLVIIVSVNLTRMTYGISKVYQIVLIITLICLMLSPVHKYEYPLDKSGGYWAVEEVERVSRVVAEMTSSDGKVLTFNPIITYEAHRKGFDVLNIGGYSNFSHALSAEECKKYKVFHVSMLDKWFNEGAIETIAIRTIDMQMIPKHIWDIISANYFLVTKFDKWGQFYSELYLLKRR